MLEKIKQYSKDTHQYAIDCYRHIHTHPELSYQEFETSAFIQEQLKSMGIPFKAGIAKTGILAKIEGMNPKKKTIALRADMDALPIQEAVDIPWKSTKSNVMHACGHDAHIACLLGAISILNKIKDQFEGTILFIFQPGEEKDPGGASLMLQDGIFSEYNPELILAQHVAEDYPTGTISFREGTVMASADEIHLTIQGQGGHGAKPHKCNDTVLAACQTIVALQQVRSRLCPPLTPMVLTFGNLIAKGATNIIPHEVKIDGTFRTFDENWRKEGKKHIRRIIEDTCSAFGCTCIIDMPNGYPCVTNNTALTRKIKSYAEELIGKEKVIEYDCRLSSEDFGFFSQIYTSCFYRLGIKGNKPCGPSHSPTFVVDEQALMTGVSGLAWFAYKCLTD